jgi:hypothetical protein
MSIPFENIYESSISLFDDPAITSAYNSTPIEFFQIMYNYLKNAIPRFNNPKATQLKLAIQIKPSGYTEIFDGNGGAVYHLSTTPIDDSYFNYIVGDTTVSGTFDKATNEVTFSVNIPSGTTGSCEWYYAGSFEPDSAGNELNITAQDILSRLLVLQWCQKEKNFLLDIRRLLNDTDFHLGSEANSIRAKDGWYSNMASEVATKMNQYAWGLQFA